MRVRQTIESGINIWASKSIVKQISSILAPLPFELYKCRSIIDAFIIPHFILFLDGMMITNDNHDIDVWECFLCNWSGRMKKCSRCRHYYECIHEMSSDETIIGTIKFEPDFKSLIILLNKDKMQRQVEGLIAMIPPMSSSGQSSPKFNRWVRSISLAWHKKALIWRERHDRWHTVEIHRKSSRFKTAPEIAKKRWGYPKKIIFELKSPGMHENSSD